MGIEDELSRRGIPSELHGIILSIAGASSSTKPAHRTAESVEMALVASISNNAKLSGRHSYEKGLARLIELRCVDPDFRKLLSDMSERILLIFPDESEEVQSGCDCGENH